MKRIYVSMTESEVEMLDVMKEEFERREGFKISRQKFVRIFFSKRLNDEFQK